MAEGLAFARLHLGDIAIVQHHAADELHVEVALAERALGRLADGRERGRKEIIEARASSDLTAEFFGARLEFVIAQTGDFVLQRVDGIDA